MSRGELDGPGVVLASLGVAPGVDGLDAGHDVGDEAEWVQLQRSLVTGQRGSRRSVPSLGHPQPEVGGCIVGLGGEGALQEAAGLRETAEHRLQIPLRGQSLGEVWLQAQGSIEKRLGPGIHAPEGETRAVVELGQPGVGQRHVAQGERRVGLHGALEVVPRLEHVLRGALLEEMDSQEVELVGLGRGRRTR